MDLRKWLSSIGLERFAEAFEKNDIDFAILTSLSEADLEKLGVDSLGARRKILTAVATLSSAGKPSAALPREPATALSGQTLFQAPAVRGAPANATPDLPGATQFAGARASSATPSPLLTSAATQFSSLSSQADGASLVGQKLRGRYQLLAEVGRGAMGVVYKAFDDVTKLDVAVKTLLPEQAKNAALMAQMANEVALAQQVSHANLLRVHHLETGTMPFLVMEYIDGGTLTERWESRQRRLPVEDVRVMLGCVLDGLEALHARNLFHRDVKPDNVLVSRAGDVKLADYGVASTLREQLAGGAQGGTPLYMSPEQLRGERADARSDVYAVGMMAHQLLLGDFPFAATSMEAVRAWHLTGDRALPALRALPLGDVFARALAVVPTERFQTAREMRAALQETSSAVDPRAWWRLPEATTASIRPRLSSRIFVDGNLREGIDSALVLRKGAAIPGWRTVEGRVVLETTSLALVGVGLLAARNDVERAVEYAVGGDVRALRALPKQSPELEAELAVAACIGGAGDQAPIHLGRAESGVSVTAHLAVAAAQLRVLNDAGAARARVDQAWQVATTVKERLAVVSFRWGVEGNRARALQWFEALKEEAKTKEDWVYIACAYAALGADDFVDGCLERTFSPASGGVDDEGLLALMSALVTRLGARAWLRAWVQRAEDDAHSSAELRRVAALWQALGDQSAAARVRTQHQNVLQAQHAALAARAAAIGIGLAQNAAPLTDDGVESIAHAIERQETLHRRASELIAFFVANKLPAPAWRRPYDEDEIAKDEVFQKEQFDLHSRADECEKSAIFFGLPIIAWQFPYSAEAVVAREQQIGQQRGFIDGIQKQEEWLRSAGVNPPARPPAPLAESSFAAHLESMASLLAENRRRRTKRMAAVSFMLVVLFALGAAGYAERDRAKKAADAAADAARTPGATALEPKTGATWVWMLPGRPPGTEREVEGFWMAQTETTVAQYRACVRAGACSEPVSYVNGARNHGTWSASPGSFEKHPVTDVDRHQATAFCAWVGARLPTDAEWHHAASNGGTTKYPWGDAEPDGKHANFCDRNWNWSSKVETADDGFAETSPACSFPAGHNRDGVCDLAGNALEWTTSGVDSKNAENELRGGLLINSPALLRVWCRKRGEPARRFDNLGFRCAQ